MKINLLHDDFYSKEYTLFALKSNLQDYRLAYFFNKKTALTFNRMTTVSYTHLTLPTINWV